MDPADPDGESANQKAARLRRERRNAKILAGGSERLDKITSLNGRPAPAEARTFTPPATQPQQSPLDGSTNDDPEEVDISQMFRRPPVNHEGTTQDDFLRQMMAATGDAGHAGSFPDGAVPSADDPMQQMMQQMQQLLGGTGGLGDGAGLPPGLASMFGGQSQTQTQPSSPLDYMWRIVHALFALALGLYAALNVRFVGSEEARLDSMLVHDSHGARIFWIFATTELVLQSTRYMLDHGQLPPSGILYTVGAMLPEPYAGYIRTFGRYSIIWTTIVSDAMVIIFILGCMAWWHGLTTS